jgi:hypothetical protein
MPGVTYTRQVQFTPHGVVVMHVLTAPKPDGLWALRPVLSNGALTGRERVTDIQKDVSSSATVAGVNGDFFAWNDGTPSGILMQNHILQRPPHELRSSIGVDRSGRLQVQRVAFYGTWQGLGQRWPLTGLNQPPGTNGMSLFTPAWGPTTPALPGAVEAIVPQFPPAVPGVELAGNVIQVVRNGNTPIPAGGAVFVARGTQATRLLIDAPVLTRIAARLTLKPEWGDVLDAIGGGPVIVRGGAPVFRAFEAFTPSQISPRDPRTAVGQRRDGTVILLAVDGRQPGYSVGVSNFELAQALVRLGAVTGSALDSGGSTTIAFDGQLLNRPSDPGGERPVSEALLVEYFGIYAPEPAVPVLSPNGDGFADRQTLAYKVVRPSYVTAKLIGPGGATEALQDGDRPPGTYRISWAGTNGGGAVLPEGRWRWVVSALDDQGERSSTERAFSLNNTLGFLSVPSSIVVRKGRVNRLAAFTLAHPARITARVETATGVRMVTLVKARSRAAGAVTLKWNGRDARRRLVFRGRYRLRLRAANAFGVSEILRPFSVRR